ncbi:hypothetical protein [Noviherbaspirillum malthae]|uniref:hypothetical protein n=1 Tax=Noviherbaspirillum malthae TaxID=1260987 RepID=UPI00189000DB|nr:hypothetical protein [Noviherbaspirillum malthae]
MSLNTNDCFKWMIDAGVPPMEVLWLQRMQGSEKLKHPVAVRRVEEMMKVATAGLLGMVNYRSPQTLVRQ